MFTDASPPPPAAPGNFQLLRRLKSAFWAIFRSESSPQSRPTPPTAPLVSGLSGMDLAELIRERFYSDRQWARDRRSVWSARSTLLRSLVFFVSVLGIIFLGLAQLDGVAAAGFILTTVGASISALESFFNWRARWVAADAALASWHMLEESLSLYVASTPVSALETEILLEFDSRRRATWDDMSGAWLAERRGQSSA